MPERTGHDLPAFALHLPRDFDTDVLHIMKRIGDPGAGFRSITENIDTTAGRMMTPIVGTFADFERAMVRERTSAAMAVFALTGC